MACLDIFVGFNVYLQMHVYDRISLGACTRSEGSNI